MAYKIQRKKIRLTFVALKDIVYKTLLEMPREDYVFPIIKYPITDLLSDEGILQKALKNKQVIAHCIEINHVIESLIGDGRIGIYLIHEGSEIVLCFPHYGLIGCWIYRIVEFFGSSRYLRFFGPIRRRFIIEPDNLRAKGDEKC